MEDMGIIRRLDTLGRIVIPREYRKLYRIEVGDPLEMRALGSGEIVVRKVDLSAQLKSIGALAVSSLAGHLDKRVAVCSLDTWLLCSSNACKSELEGEELPVAVVEAMSSQRPTVLECESAGIASRSKYIALYPVLGETGMFGALVLFTDAMPDETEAALMETVAQFTGRSMQNF